MPTTQILAATTLSPASAPTSHAFVPIVFSAPAQVVAGTQYAIVLHTLATGGNIYQLRDNIANAYSAGEELGSFASPPTTWNSHTPYDLAFKTYVVGPTVAPPPSETGRRAAALRKCKKKVRRPARRRCRKKANKLPL